MRQPHVSSLDPAVSRKTFHCDASFFGGMQGPTLGSVLEIPVLYVGEKERVPGEHFGFAVNGVVPVQPAHKSHRFFVRQSRGPPFQAADTRHHRMIGHDIHLLIHPDVVIDIR